jgi:UDP-N-acetylglucosamine:LPS N-acetylglucosamine transferase
MKNQPRRILAIASGGGHWVELMRLKPAFEGLDVAYASVFAASAGDVPGHRFYSFDDVSRFRKARIVSVFWQITRIVLRERPSVVITTGSFPALMALGVARTLLGARTIWIDSVANCQALSTSGRLARRVADIWLTQWPHLTTPDGPEHWGAVL